MLRLFPLVFLIACTRYVAQPTTPQPVAAPVVDAKPKPKNFVCSRHRGINDTL